MKFGFPMAGAMTQVAWGGITFQAGFEAAGQMDYLKSTLKWGTDYFIAAHTSSSEFIGQVGDGYADHGVWTRPEDLNMARPSFSMTCGSDLAGETAAALAASSLVYRNMGDDVLADEALSHARELFDFANNCKDVYTNQIPAADFYKYEIFFYIMLMCYINIFISAHGADMVMSWLGPLPGWLRSLVRTNICPWLNPSLTRVACALMSLLDLIGTIRLLVHMSLCMSLLAIQSIRLALTIG